MGKNSLEVTMGSKKFLIPSDTEAAGNMEF